MRVRGERARAVRSEKKFNLSNYKFKDIKREQEKSQKYEKKISSGSFFKQYLDY